MLAEMRIIPKAKANTIGLLNALLVESRELIGLRPLVEPFVFGNLILIEA
jgi:hypothetical protein